MSESVTKRVIENFHIYYIWSYQIKICNFSASLSLGDEAFLAVHISNNYTSIIAKDGEGRVRNYVIKLLFIL